MNEPRAREVLGVNADASLDEVEAAFRRMASISHPDKGGSTDEMAEVLAARDTLVGTKSASSNELIPIDVVRNLVRVVAHQNESSTRRHELNKLHADFQLRSTNRLKDRRRLAAIVASVAAAVTIFGKDLPIDDLVEVGAIPRQQEIERAKKEIEGISLPTPIPVKAPLSNGQKAQQTAEEKAYETAIAAATSKREFLKHQIDNLETSKAETARMKSMFRVMTAFLAMMLAMFAWFLSQLISRTEREIEEFEERTETRGMRPVIPY